jgi:hypothetical protein
MGLDFPQSFLESIYPQMTQISQIYFAPAGPTIHADKLRALLLKPSNFLDNLNQIQSQIGADSICAN